MVTPTVIEAELTWTRRGFEAGVGIGIDAEGRIARLEPVEVFRAEAAAPVTRLTGRAVLPGFVNTHSHAFQRGLRGHGETFREGQGSFWTWRERMYDLVESMDEPGLERWCRQAFSEMLAAGITTVGEFHYLHHARERDFAFDEVVLRAAHEIGIRIVLLAAAYERGGFGVPLDPKQHRFHTHDPETLWSQVDRLAAAIVSPVQTLGIAPHSLRAVSIEHLAALHAEASRRGMVCHVHLEEQPEEIEACRAAHGCTPIKLLSDHLEVDESLVAVHCTHSEAEDLALFLEQGGRVCVCPLTEANLGDGIADLAAMRRRGARISLGSDSNTRISMIEEMRLAEYGQRLRAIRRGVCVDDDGRAAPALLDMATLHGADALGVKTGRLSAGAWADLTVIDLEHPDLDGWSAETLLESIVFGADNSVVTETWVGGRRVWARSGTQMTSE